ncbi:MAG: TIGR03087 family PEP-CTERM/XrtA system glycosyltransferase [Candidatus Krumholzibacteriota bacterium]|nr:TIGR03087 family PEP-CTERM/XrtA system glycosyltransferase [Candidatus Krumholzibacteriota bacterium]
MRILFLTARLPFPPIGGDKLRAFNFIKYLARHHDVDLISFISDQDEIDNISEYSPLVGQCHTVKLSKKRSYFNSFCGLFSSLPLQIKYYSSAKMQQVISRQLKTWEYDLIFVHLFRMAEFVKDYDQVPKLLDLTDALSLNYERSEKFMRGASYLLNFIEKKRVFRYESDIIEHFDKNIFVSPVDKNYFTHFDNHENVDVIPNGVDVNYFQYFNQPPDFNKLVFLGNMRTFPNADAVVYFVEKIMPLVRKEKPDISLYIVGSEPTRKVKKCIHKKNIFVTGSVDDVRPYLQQAAVSVCPMRTGAGVKNKILESMAVGTPVVSTTRGAEGLETAPGENIVISDSAEQFAGEIIKLLENRVFHKKISLNGRKLVEERYTWNRALGKIDQMIDDFSGHEPKIELVKETV